MLLSPFYENPDAPCDQPVILQIAGCDDFFVAVFETEDALSTVMDAMGQKDYKIKKVDDLHDFITSVREAGVRIMCNPYFVNGKCRWTEIINQDDPDEVHRIEMDPMRRRQEWEVN